MEAEHLRMFDQMREHLIERARKVAEMASSYRDFKVGCAILVWRPEGQTTLDHYSILTAANVKPRPDGPKACAEQTVVCYAMSNGWTRVIAMAVAGEPQADEKSGLTPPTLHPCWLCRTLLKSLPIVSDDTIVLTAHNHAGTVEDHTFKEVLEIHGE